MLLTDWPPTLPCATIAEPIFVQPRREFLWIKPAQLGSGAGPLTGNDGIGLVGEGRHELIRVRRHNKLRKFGCSEQKKSEQCHGIQVKPKFRLFDTDKGGR